MNAVEIKERVLRLGADLCGIAPADRLAGAPKGFGPTEIWDECRSVVVFASRFPRSALSAKTPSPYTFVRNRMVEKLDTISFALAEEMERAGAVSIPIPSSEPYDFWDNERRHGRGILSLKHAGVLAGLGVMGRNTLLINETFGNMIWLGAVLVSEALAPDPVAAFSVCGDGCGLCLEACPAHALDGVTIDQKRCRERMITTTGGGGWVLSCNTCRVVCPHVTGM